MKKRSHKHSTGVLNAHDEKVGGAAKALGTASGLEIYNLPRNFNYLEKMDNIIWMRWFTCCFRGTKHMRNADIYKQYFSYF